MKFLILALLGSLMVGCAHTMTPQESSEFSFEPLSSERVPATHETSERDIARLLGKNNTILCDVVKPGPAIGMQIQFDGARRDWVVWMSGAGRGAVRMLKVTDVQLDGMNMLTEFNIELEHGYKIEGLQLDPKGKGRGYSVTHLGNRYPLENCRSKF